MAAIGINLIKPNRLRILPTVFFVMADNDCEFTPFPKTRIADLPYIYLKDVSKSFSDNAEERFGIERLSFGVPAGEITAIIGESGSGKSTLLRLIYGLIGPDKGNIYVDGLPLPRPEDKLIPGHEDMRMVSQGFDDLNTYAKVWDNVAGRLSNTDLTAKKSKTENTLNRLNIGHLRDQRVADLSGGEKQRVAIARALVTEPAILLLDEPFNQVDASFRDQLQQDIRQIVDNTGLTVIMVSHDPGEVLSLAQNLVVIKSGKLMAFGKPQEIYQLPPNTYVARLLCKSNILHQADGPLLSAQWQAKEVVVHPEWLSLHEPDKRDHLFVIEYIAFKGFYEELFLRHGQLSLRVVNTHLKQYNIGQAVKVIAERYVELDVRY